MAKKDDGNNHKYWSAVLYPENMIENWQAVLPDLLQLPGAYCIHDKDKDKNRHERKSHVHMILAFHNTTTYNFAMTVFKKLGVKAVNTIEFCIDVRTSYDYLIHDTENARKQGKYQYDPSERIEFNNFDIGKYEQIDLADKERMLQELIYFIIDNGFQDICQFTIEMDKNFDSTYWQILLSYSATLERFCRANYHNGTRALIEATKAKQDRENVKKEVAKIKTGIDQEKQ